MKRKTAVSALLAILVTLVFTSVVPASPPAAEMDESSLKSRVDQAWTAKVGSDMPVLYDMTAETYRKEHPKETFGAKSNVSPKQYTLRSIDIRKEDRSASVVVDYVVVHNNFEFPFTSTERWVWENGNWYLDIQ
jgi:hypothetical protein